MELESAGVGGLGMGLEPFSGQDGSMLVVDYSHGSYNRRVSTLYDVEVANVQGLTRCG